MLNVEKSRYVREKSKIPISVTFDRGISPWSGLLDLALETGHVVKPSNGWYSKVDTTTGEIEDKKFRLKDTNTRDFWLPVLTGTDFAKALKEKFQLAQGDMIQDDENPTDDE